MLFELSPEISSIRTCKDCSLTRSSETSTFGLVSLNVRKNPNVYEELNWRRLFRTDYWGLEMFEVRVDAVSQYESVRACFKFQSRKFLDVFCHFMLFQDFQFSFWLGQGDWTHKSFRPLTVLTFRWNHAIVGSFAGQVNQCTFFESDISPNIVLEGSWAASGSGFHMVNVSLNLEAWPCLHSYIDSL